MSLQNKIDIAPLSMNRAYQGRKVKTKWYRKYQKDLDLLLPPKSKIEIPNSGQLMLIMEIGVSRRFDWDNSIKPFQDILQARYEFDDARVHMGICRKRIVKRGHEYISWEIKPFTNETITIDPHEDKTVDETAGIRVHVG